MNEAKEKHCDLMNALLPILPRKVYRDRHRVVNLVWVIAWRVEVTGEGIRWVRVPGAHPRAATSVSLFASCLSRVTLLVVLG
jgi:hypothetical protein